jgi:hypothetical protein
MGDLPFDYNVSPDVRDRLRAEGFRAGYSEGYRKAKDEINTTIPLKWVEDCHDELYLACSQCSSVICRGNSTAAQLLNSTRCDKCGQLFSIPTMPEEKFGRQ